VCASLPKYGKVGLLLCSLVDYAIADYPNLYEIFFRSLTNMAMMQSFAVNPINIS
jgi:hypothetical protein